MWSMAFIVAFVLGSALVPSRGPANAAGPSAPFEDGTVLAGFHAGVGDAAAAAIERQEGASRVKVVGVGTHVLQVGPGRVAEKIAALQRHREVAYAAPDYIVRADTTPNDPQSNKQWGYLKI